MAIVLGDFECYGLAGGLVSMRARGPFHACLTEDLVPATRPDNKKYTLSIWIAGEGLECLARGSLLSRAETSPSPSSAELSIITSPSAPVVCQVLWMSNAKRVVVALRDELVFVNLIWSHKRDNKELSVHEVLQNVATLQAARNKLDSPYLSESIGLKLKRSDRLVLPELSYLMVEGDRGLIAADKSGNLFRVTWEGTMTASLQRNPSANSISTISDAIIYSEPVLYSIWNRESFSLQHREPLHLDAYRSESIIDMGNGVTAAAQSEQLRILALLHQDGSFAIARLTQSGVITTPHVYPVLRQLQPQASRLRAPAQKTAGRILSLELVDDRGSCGADASLLVLAVRTKTPPNETVTNNLHVDHRNSVSEAVDYLVVLRLKMCAAAEVEVSTLHVCEVGRTQELESYDFFSGIRRTGLHSSRGAVIALFSKSTRSITGHGLRSPETSLFKINVDISMNVFDFWIGEGRLFLASTSDISSGYLHSVHFKSIPSSNSGNYHLLFERNENEWCFENLKSHSSWESPSFPVSCYNSLSGAVSVVNTATVQNNSSTDYLVRESHCIDPRLRVSIPPRAKIELMACERGIICCESVNRGLAPTSGYLAIVSEAKSGDIRLEDEKDSILLWFHSRQSKRWRGTCIDFDSDSLAIMCDVGTSSDSVPNIKYASRSTALKGPFSGAVTMQWFGNHSVILLTRRKARYCIEIVSREVGATSHNMPRPALHHVLPLVAGVVPRGMSTSTGLFNVSKKGVRSETLLVTVMDEANISVYQVVAHMKVIDTLTPSLVDYSLALLWEINLLDCPMLALPLRRVIPLQNASTCSLVVLDLDGKVFGINRNPDSGVSSTALAEISFIDIKLEELADGLDYVALVAQDQQNESSLSSLLYLPSLEMTFPAPALPRLSCYCGVQSHTLLCLRESDFDKEGNRKSQAASIGTARASVTQPPTISQGTPGQLVIREVSLHFHMFYGIVKFLVANLPSTSRAPANSDVEARVEACLDFLNKFLQSLTVRGGRQVFADDIEHRIIALASLPRFKNTYPEYRVISCVLHAFARPLLAQILTRTIRRLEVHVAHKLFPVPCSLDVLVGRRVTSIGSDARALTPLSLFLACVSVQPDGSYADASLNLLGCSARLLTFACEHEGGTESYSSTERCVSLSLEVLREAALQLSLRVAVHCLDFTCRLEDALESFPLAQRASNFNIDADEESEALQLTTARRLTACNDRLWRENGILSSFGMASPMLSYLVGGGALWVVGRTIGAVASVVSAELPAPPVPISESSNQSSDIHLKTYISCSRFLAASRVILAAVPGQMPNSTTNSDTSRDSLSAAFVALTCADLLKHKKYLSCSLFAAATATSELARERIRVLLAREAVFADLRAASSRDHEFATLSAHESEDWDDVQRGLGLAAVGVTSCELRAKCCDEANSLGGHESFLLFDLPDNLQSLISEASVADTPRSPRVERKPVVLPKPLVKGLCLGLLISGQAKLSRKCAVSYGGWEGGSAMDLVGWTLD